MLYKYMKLALDEAKKSENDVPVGAVIVKNDEIIALEHNKKEKLNQLTAHAEILAINSANSKLNNWRLEGAKMFVTLEPCPMCAWAILNSRISELYFGSYDNLYGGFSTVKLDKYFNSKLLIKGGIMEEECDNLIRNYFKGIRK